MAEQPNDPFPASSPRGPSPTPSVRDSSPQQQQRQQQQQQAYCVGIDLGNSTSVVASASPLNPQSVGVDVNRLANRATPSAVAFDGKTRVVGEEAESRMSSLPGSCVQQLASWLAIGSQADAEALFRRLPFCPKPQLQETPEGLAFLINTGDGEKQLPVVLAVGHFLRVLLSFAEASRRSGGASSESQGGPQALTVAIPCSNLAAAAQRLLLAAAAVGLDERLSLSIIPRSAALLNCWCARHLPGAFHDLQQQQQEQQQQEQQQQLFIGLVDVGFMETVVQIVRLEEKDTGSVDPTTLSTKFDSNLGVAEGINLVAGFVASEVRSRHREEVYPHSKKAARLFASCWRAVTHLSGLTDSSIDIEGFLEDEGDVHVSISRQQFEDLCAPLRATLEGLINSALAEASLSAADVVAVDVVGGGSRIPWVVTAIEEAFAASHQQQQQQRSKIRRTLDGGSSVAMGAASSAAGLSFVSPLDLAEVKQNINQHVLQVLQGIDRELGSVETAELQRLEARNCLEAYLLEMQAAARGPRGASLQQPAVQQLLTETEHWLLDHEAATQAECAAALERVKETLESQCKDYFEAVASDRKKQETDLEASAAAAAANVKEDMDVKLPNSQCIKRAKKNKEEANELFRDGNVELAVQRYIKGLQYLARMFDLAPQEKEETEALRLSLHLNLAQAYLRLTGTDPKAPQYEAFAKKALGSADSALELDPQCVKAFYRRAVANERLKEYSKGLADVKKALSIVPEDTDFLKLKERLEARLKAEKEQQKKIYSRMFG
ncbi:hypothetical protein Esti_000221 [Eimeria stiedai]